MKLLFTRPITGPRGPALPADFQPMLNEGRLSAVLGRRLPTKVAEYTARSVLATSVLARSAGHDAVITGRYGEFLALVRALLPWPRRPHLLLDVEWPHRRAGRLRSLVSRWFHRWVAAGASRIQVFCHAEAHNYARHYGIDMARFVWIPYCTDRPAEAPESQDGDYIFTGGRQHRDQQTLWAALERLPYPVRVAGPPELKRSLPGNVQVLGPLPRAEFLAQLAGARLVVLSLEAGLMRYPGVITYVTAMALGKCVVVNDPHGAVSYIADGRTGVIVPERSPDALGNAITRLWEDDNLRQTIAGNAGEHAARHLSTERYFRDIRAVCRALVRGEEVPPCFGC
jgi:glycosyltransferase involved in cell wall biosynthesis